MAGFEIEGKLVKAYDMEVKGTSSFRTREFVIETMETYPQFVKFQSVQDKTSIIDKANIGDEIKVYFNIKGSKWEKEGKVNYITNLDAWRIEQVSNAGTDQTAIDSEYMEPLDNFSASSPEAIDDLPF